MQKNIYVPVIGKYHKCFKTNLVYFKLAQFHPKKAMSQPPCFNICYRPFLSRKLKWSKIQNIYCNFLNFEYNNIPIRLVSTASSTIYSDYSYGIVYQPQLEYFETEIPSWSVSLLRNAFFEILGSNVVPVVWSWMYQFFSFFFLWIN